MRKSPLWLLLAVGWVASATAFFQGVVNVGPRTAGRSLSLRRHVSPLRAQHPAPLAFNNRRSSRLSMSTAPLDFTVEPVEDKIPITLLSGFLGSGKTTLLREMLQNKGGLKIGVVVNDMAAINIDAKLVKSDLSGVKDDNTPKGDSVLGGGLLDTSDVLELQNGCACCSASEELLSSVMKLLLVSAEREEPYDRIIIEMSGVAEPKNIRKQFFDASWSSHPALEYSELKNMVTVVDSANFMRSFSSADSVIDRPDLIEEDSSMMAADRAIVDLLTEQVEVADYILLNKADRLPDERMSELKAIVTALNPSADVIQCSYGKVDLDVVLGATREKWVADADDEDDFRVSVRAATKAKEIAAASAVVAAAKDSSSSHGHELSNEAKGHQHDSSACADEECSDPSHDHAHGEKAASHSHSHDSPGAAVECADDECTDSSHGHSHGEPSVVNAHSHDSSAAAAECADDACTDPSHSHGESHEHAHSHASSASIGSASMSMSPEDKFGISSFVYSRRKPFHPDRLKELIAKLPVISGQDEQALEGWVMPEAETAAELAKNKPLHNIIRSKGFVWVSTYHRVALYWSHAGQFFDLKDFGMFWASTPLKYWPREITERSQVIADFGMGEKWGDRRQELVFIGIGLQQPKIESILDQALLTDEEMVEYEKSTLDMPDRVKMDWTTSPPIPRDVKVEEKAT